MVFPADKETWRRVEGKDLPLSKLGDVIEDTDHNDYADFLERLQDVLGLTILAGFGSVKLRLADMDTKIGDVGDFLADGSVPMTGDLDLDIHDLDNVKQITGQPAGILTIEGADDHGIYIAVAGVENFTFLKGSTTLHTYLDCNGNELYNILYLKGKGDADLLIIGDTGYGVEIRSNGTTVVLECKSDGKAEFKDDLKILGDTSIKTYSQNNEPTLDTDEKCCFWKDTDDANKIYLVYRRGVGDQVKIQLT